MSTASTRRPDQARLAVASIVCWMAAIPADLPVRTTGYFWRSISGPRGDPASPSAPTLVASADGVRLGACETGLLGRLSWRAPAGNGNLDGGRRGRQR